MPPNQPEDSSYLDRLVALNLLRENMYFNNPSTYAWTDVAEDLPGPAKAVGHLVKDILPSKVIISEDPEERKKQIQKAVERIKASKNSKGHLINEVLGNVTEMAKSSIVPSLGFSLIARLLALRSPFGKKMVNGVMGKSLRSPFRIKETLKHLFSNRKGFSGSYRKQFLKGVGSDVATGALLNAAHGAAFPILAHYTDSPKALEEAQKIMEENPYITSLPAGEMMGALKMHGYGEKGNALKNIVIGTALGTTTGLLGAAPMAAVPGLRLLFTNASKDPKLRETLLRTIKKNLSLGGKFGAGFGALQGLLSKGDYVNEEYQQLKDLKSPSPQENLPYLAEEELRPSPPVQKYVEHAKPKAYNKYKI